MLVLGRHEDETIQVDGPCTITVIRVGDGHPKMTVRLGIDAHPSVTILRGELVPQPPHQELET